MTPWCSTAFLQSTFRQKRSTEGEWSIFKIIFFSSSRTQTNTGEISPRQGLAVGEVDWETELSQGLIFNPPYGCI